MIALGESKAHYIMIGGFLGAGKTTTLARLGQYLIDRGLRVGLISNDQSTGLVDTAMLRAKGFDVEEIVGGCFCCRFNSLVDAANKLTAESRPHVFVAEPVGSCTDLVATVSYPLRRIYGDQFSTAPLSVLVDPTRCARILGLIDGRSFSPKVSYIYLKQLEEADLIVINKCDDVAPALQRQLAEKLRESYPLAEVLCCSARSGLGLDVWFERITSSQAKSRATMLIDYAEYAEGEALLGWLNCTIQLTKDEPFDANALLVDLASELRDKIGGAGFEIAHLKMTLDAGDAAGNLSVVSLLGSDQPIDLRESLLDQIDGGELIINLRAEADPEFLREATLNALKTCVNTKHGVATQMEHMEHFRPGKPEPTHRITVAS